MAKTTFSADKVKIRTNWKVDNTSTVEFSVGEYQQDKLKELVGVIDKELIVTVEEVD